MVHNIVRVEKLVGLSTWLGNAPPFDAIQICNDSLIIQSMLLLNFKKLNKHGIELGWFNDLEFQATNVRN